MSIKPKHILVIRLSAMGDIAMTVPVLRAFSRQHPDTRITVLTRELFAPFFRGIPNVEVHNAEVKGKHKGISGLYQLSKELKELNIDSIADLHNVLRTNILKVFLRGLPFVQIDKGRTEKKALTSGKAFRQLKSTHQRYADVFEALGYKIDLLNPVFPEKSELADEIQTKLGVKTQKWVGIAPFAQYESKMYPLVKMKEVINTLNSYKDIKILLFGGGEFEVSQLDDIQSNYENVINVAGKFTLDQELDIISNLDLMLSMDSSNAHIAAMLGIKVITLWGVTHPYAGFYPFDQNDEWAILANKDEFPKIPTSVYGNKYPKDYGGLMGSISSVEVVKKIKSLL